MARSNQRGFTLIEILTVVGIVAVLSALGFALIEPSKRSGKIVVTLGRLHQCQLAVALYTADTGVEGLPDLMDFVNGTTHGKTFYGVGEEMTTSACGLHPESSGPHFTIFLDSSEPAGNGRIAGESGTKSPVLFADENCNEPDVHIRSDYVTKLGLGVLFDGSLLRRRHQGSVGSRRFWEDSP